MPAAGFYMRSGVRVRSCLCVSECVMTRQKTAALSPAVTKSELCAGWVEM